MIRRPPRSTRTDTLFPYTTLFRSFWQLQRMHEKQAMLDAVGTVLGQRQAQPLAAAADPLRRNDYDWSAGEGRFADLPPVLLDNQSREERAGVRAYRVFQPDGGAPLLAELGWLTLRGDRSSEERSGGNECVSTCSSRWAPEQ